ncbi:hypothetical protein GGF31_002495 [Allomyces arbusculus]|nr:hypothetical protein GGF31_002495 [Allomyces arbusculus]
MPTAPATTSNGASHADAPQPPTTSSRTRTIYVIRHGARADWEPSSSAQLSWQSPTGHAHDPPLSKTGRAQSRDLARFLAREGILDVHPAVLVSPYSRCWQTIAPALAPYGHAIGVEPGIREWHSREFIEDPDVDKLCRVFAADHNETAEQAVVLDSDDEENDPKAVFKDHEYWQRSVRVNGAWRALVVPSRELAEGHDSQLRGETEDELHLRAVQFVRELLGNEEVWARSDTVVLVTHAATAIALGRAIVGHRHARIHCATASTSKYVESDDGQWQCLWNGRYDYLRSGAVRDWTFHTDTPDTTVSVRAASPRARS